MEEGLPPWMTIFDFLLAPFYIMLVVMLGYAVRNININQKPYYKYYVSALVCKVIGGVSLCLVYTFWYKEGGDSTNYFLAGSTYSRIFTDFNFELLDQMLSFRSESIAFLPYYDYGIINFSDNDYYALTTSVISSFFCLLGMNCYIPATILLSYVSFLCMWKLFEVFIDKFPQLQKEFAYSILFVPSVFFWGSGMLKDTYSISGLALATFAVYKFLIQQQRKFKFGFMLLGSSAIIILIKPYIFFALIPGTLIWVFFDKLNTIRNPTLRALFLPGLLTLVVVIVAVILQYFGDYLGDYSLDKVFNKAAKTQQDFARNQQYGANSYDIGEFDASLAGVLSKIPAALEMALFRPYLWNVRNPVMLLSALENFIMLSITIYIFWKVKFKVLIKSLFSDPLLIFSMLFALFFAFSVGLTTANYGALVRLKIPCIPFYASSLFILYYLNKESFGNRRLGSSRNETYDNSFATKGAPSPNKQPVAG